MIPTVLYYVLELTIYCEIDIETGVYQGVTRAIHDLRRSAGRWKGLERPETTSGHEISSGTDHSIDSLLNATNSR